MFDAPATRPNWERQGHLWGILTGLIIVVVTVIWIAPAIENFMAKRDELLKAHVPLSAYSYGGHEWITFDKGGLYHHPDCPSQHPERK